ncbi:MAG TPA: response regulator [Vicinamibacterales bacterium]|jgi:PAS domain S-box-containing protein
MPLRILHLEDDRGDASLVAATLDADGLEADIYRVDTREEFERALADRPIDLILADYNLPHFDGVSAQVTAARIRPDVPFIFVSGSIGEECAVDRLKAGATDYVLKDRMARLPSALRRALAEAAERAERRRAEDDVRRLNAVLEQRVVERTRALEQANAALAQREAARAESERRLQAILDHSPAAVALKDLSGRYVLTNRTFEQLAGRPAAEIAGRTDEELFPAPLAEMYRSTDRRVMALASGREVEETFLHGGVPHTYQSIKFPLLDEAQRAYALCTIAIDITERKKQDDELKMARRDAERANRAKSDFLSRMSHDLRTPLNAILGFAQLLELSDLPPEGQESVSQILKGGNHLLQLINEVLDIARIEAGHLSLSPEPVSALEAVRETVSLVAPLAASRSIAVRIDAPAKEPIILADRQRLNQILLNLLSNAVKYNRAGGAIVVAIQQVSSTRLRIAVTDTGAGIPPAKLALLFRPFERLGAEQTEVEGTGLGLALSQALAEAMGGSLTAESAVDRGTTFALELTATDHARPRLAPAPSPGEAVSSLRDDISGAVLYIEDNQANVRLMERVLQRRPAVRLLHASSGAKGLERAKAERPQLIFLDLHLPDMTGDVVLDQIWRDPSLRAIPVAVLSADATAAHRRRLEASGIVAYLTKPLNIQEVMRLVDDRLGVGASGPRR